MGKVDDMIRHTELQDLAWVDTVIRQVGFDGCTGSRGWFSYLALDLRWMEN